VRYLPPRPWAQVKSGDVVMSFNGITRAVIANDPHPRLAGHCMLLLEGLAEPLVVRDYMPACVVELDTADAIGNLYAAGFTVTPIEGNGS
jgi:hypothetical protein